MVAIIGRSRWRLVVWCAVRSLVTQTPTRVAALQRPLLRHARSGHRTAPQAPGRRSALTGRALLAETTLAAGGEVEEKQRPKGEGKRERWTSEWELVLGALEVYKSIHGNLRVPTRFVIPGDEQEGDIKWPAAYSELKLGMRVAAIRSTGRYVAGNEQRRSALDDMGFEWRLRQPRTTELEMFDEPYETVYEALRCYKEVHSDLSAIEEKFVVPHLEPWPQACRGLPLGARVRALQRAESTHPYLDETRLSRERVEQRVKELDDLGFDWSNKNGKAAAKPAPERKKRVAAAAARFEVVFAALEQFQILQGNLDVPENFIVPADPSWPREAWRMRLGSRVNGIRSHGTFVKGHPDRAERLESLGLALGKSSPAALAQAALDDSYWTKGQTAPLGDFKKEEEKDAEANKSSMAVLDSLASGAPLALAGVPQRRRTVPVSVDFGDETIVTREERELLRERGWIFDDFGGGFDFADVIQGIEEYKLIEGDLADMPRDFVVPSVYDELSSPRRNKKEEDDVDLLSKIMEGAPEDEEDDDDGVDAALAAFLSSATTSNAPVVAPVASGPSLEDLRALLDDEEELLLEEDEEQEEGARRRWPLELGGLELGRAVESMRIGDASAQEIPERREALDAVGFDWGFADRRIRGVIWNRFLSAIFSYSKVKGTLAVSWDFMIPDEDPWPLPHRGDPLGLWVNLLRDQSQKLMDFYPERKRQLDHMGFLWLPAVFEEAPLEYDERLPPCLRLDNDELNEAYADTKKKRRAKRTTDVGVLPNYGTNYPSYTVPQLKELLRQRNLPTSGKLKKEYVERLRDHDIKYPPLEAPPAPEEEDDDDEEEDDDDDDDDEEEESS